MRDDEGYSDTWYDKENDEGTFDGYTFGLDSSVYSDVYIMVSTYGHAIVPLACTTGTISSGQTVNYPTAYIAVYEE